MCHKPITLKNTSRKPHNDQHLNTVPCGKCIQCIKKKRKEWAFRLHQEGKDHITAYMVTLTYNEESLPYLNQNTGEYPIRLQEIHKSEPTDILEPIVLKSDVQKFIKQIRKRTDILFKKYGTKKATHQEQRIRYYMVSEYGTQYTRRPHYHGIIWNLQTPIARDIEIQKIWQHGDAKIEPIDGNIGSYYYLTKYLYKQKNWNIWTFKPFTLMSTKPYIGNRYLETSRHYHIAKGNLFTKFNNQEIIIPRIYRDKLPKKLAQQTREILDQNGIKDYRKHQETQKNNHHFDILQWFKQVTQEQQEQQEQIIFNNKFKHI